MHEMNSRPMTTSFYALVLSLLLLVSCGNNTIGTGNGNGGGGGLGVVYASGFKTHTNGKHR
jgi:hypothetical protein